MYTYIIDVSSIIRNILIHVWNDVITLVLSVSAVIGDTTLAVAPIAIVVEQGLSLSNQLVLSLHMSLIDVAGLTRLLS